MLFQAYKQIFSLNTGFYTDIHGFKVSVWLKKTDEYTTASDHRSATPINRKANFCPNALFCDKNLITALFKLYDFIGMDRMNPHQKIRCIFFILIHLFGSPFTTVSFYSLELISHLHAKSHHHDVGF